MQNSCLHLLMRNTKDCADCDEPGKAVSPVGASLYQTLTCSLPLESVLILTQQMREATAKLLVFSKHLWNATVL